MEIFIEIWILLHFWKVVQGARILISMKISIPGQKLCF